MIDDERISTGNPQADEILGGGFPKNSINIVMGQPGTGKSIFAEQLENFVRPRDVVIGISGSGTSPNVLRAMELARARGAVTVGLTGFDGGKLPGLCDVCVIVPSTNMGQIENVHLALQHLICELLSREIATSTSMGYGEAEPERVGR
jgi:D-sedoheptulose 7-phosphate isomerase